MRILSIASLMSLLTALIATPANGQARQRSELKDARLRTACEKRVRMLDSVGRGRMRVTAIQGLGGCSVSGVSALVRLWRQPPVDSTEIVALGFLGSSIRDRRNLQGAVAALKSVGNSDEVRLAALGTIVSQLDSTLYTSIAWLRTAEQSRQLPPQRFHALVTYGDAPATSHDLREAWKVLRTVGLSEPRTVVGRASSAVSRYFELPKYREFNEQPIDR